jgi:phage N-6-adenine-methyltransferase
VNRALLSSARGTWATPWPLFRAIDAVFHFDIDVCATADNAKCKRFFTPEQDGLKQSWAPRTCWLNPVYGRGVELWLQKAIDEAERGATVVALLPHRPDTRWWRLARRAEVTELEGRVTFEGADSPAPFPSCLCVFRPRLPSRLRVPR